MLARGMNTSELLKSKMNNSGLRIALLGPELNQRCTTDSRVVKNSGNDTATASALRILDSPVARRAAMLKAIAIR
jgi:hypothetical protein